MRKFHSIGFFIILFSLILFLTSCGGGGGITLPDNGGFLTINRVGEGCLTGEELDEKLEAHYSFLYEEGIITEEEKQELLDSLDAYMDVGMETYSVTYSSEGSRGKSNWSGLVAISTHPYPGYDAPAPTVPIVSIQHPTIVDRKYSPSKYSFNDYTNNDDRGYNIGSLKKDVIEEIKKANVYKWVKADYIVVMADYPGLGNDTETVHTFCHEESLALSIVDMIQKAINFVNSDRDSFIEFLQNKWNGQLFLVGQSEGGYATIAAAKHIQNHPELGLNIDGIVAISGPYNLSNVMRRIITQEQEYKDLHFLAYFIFGYNQFYDFFDSPSEIFKDIPNSGGKNYGEEFERILVYTEDDGSKDQRLKKLFENANRSTDIFKEAFIDDLKDDNSVYTKALKENDLYNSWTPKIPLYLIHSHADKVISIQNSFNALDYYRAEGSQIDTYWFQDEDHGLSYIEGHKLAREWVLGFKDDPDMILIPSGSFQMGSEDGYSVERPAHTVNLTKDFYMGRCEVTNAEFVQFLNGANVVKDGSGAEIGNRGIFYTTDNVLSGIGHDGNNWYVKTSYNGNVLDYARMPVVYVTWWGAVEYCNWLSEQEGLPKAYEWDEYINTYRLNDYPNNTGYRLPMEAEWEYAARGGEDHLYAGTTDNLGEYAWYWSNSDIGDGTGRHAQKVDQKKENGYGLKDMSGNVWEWCSDNWYSYTDVARTDPYFLYPDNTSSSYRIIRGGSWYYDADCCRVAYRYGWGSYDGYYRDNVGFRLARTR